MEFIHISVYTLELVRQMVPFPHTAHSGLYYFCYYDINFIYSEKL